MSDAIAVTAPSATHHEQAQAFAETIENGNMSDVVEAMTEPEGEAFGEMILVFSELIPMLSSADLTQLRRMINNKFP